MKISAVVITHNEENNILACLESIRWVDEIIVLDTHSTDKTVELARAFGAKVYQETAWDGFGPQKNKAIQYANGDWILSIDADERITPKLAKEISEQIKNHSEVEGILVPRLSSYCGKFLKHGGWWPDYVLRLCRKGRGVFSDNLVHEKLLVSGATIKLKNHIIHYSFENFEQVLGKIDKYSSLGARQLVLRGKTYGLGAALLHALSTFLKTYLLKAGFLDGQYGLMLAISNAEGTYYKYLKVMLLQKSDK